MKVRLPSEKRQIIASICGCCSDSFYDKWMEERRRINSTNISPRMERLKAMARVFITGSSDGLGLMAAQRLVREGHIDKNSCWSLTELVKGNGNLSVEMTDYKRDSSKKGGQLPLAFLRTAIFLNEIFCTNFTSSIFILCTKKDPPIPPIYNLFGAPTQKNREALMTLPTIFGCLSSGLSMARRK